MSDVQRHLCRNLVDLRARRGWTQAELAKRAGVPRSTLATIESGAGNPRIGVVVALARGLDVSLDELTGPPRGTARLYRAHELTTKTHRGVEVRHLLPHPIPGVTVERIRFAGGSRRAGVPHTPGTREYLTVETGSVALTAAGVTYLLEPGDVLAFRGDQHHGYRAVDGPCVAYSVVMPV